MSKGTTGRALGVLMSDLNDVDNFTHNSGGTAGFYGTTPIIQRAAAAQATSLLSTASSTAIDTQTKAAILEIMNTLAALGLWKGAA